MGVTQGHEPSNTSQHNPVAKGEWQHNALASWCRQYLAAMYPCVHVSYPRRAACMHHWALCECWWDDVGQGEGLYRKMGAKIATFGCVTTSTGSGRNTSQRSAVAPRAASGGGVAVWGTAGREACHQEWLSRVLQTLCLTNCRAAAQR